MEHLRIVKALMLLSGSWRAKLATLNRFQRSLYGWYSIIMNIYLICFVIALYLGVIPIWHNAPKKLVQAIPIIILCTIILIKAAICQRKKITEMIRMEHLRIVKALMLLSGSWRAKLATLNRFQRSLYGWYSIIMNIYLICFVIALYLGVIPIWHNAPKKLVQAIPIIILCTIILIKAAICQRKKITEMISKIENQEKRMNEWDEATIDIYSKNARYTQLLSLFMFTGSTLCGVTLVVTKFIVYEQQMKAAKMGLLNDTIIEKPMPYIVWRPVDEVKHYWTAFSIDVLSAAVGCTFNTITQLIFISLLTYISGQLKILQYNFRNFGAICANLEGYDEKFLALRNLIMQHFEIISFVKDLDHNMKYLLMLEFTINSFQMTGIFYELIMFERDLMLIFRLTYLSCMVLQIFLLAWHANEVSIQSIEIAYAIYDCEWYDLPKKIKEMLLFMMLRAQKPLTISVGPFFILTNSTAVTSMKGAYSYLAVLTNSRG